MTRDVRQHHALYAPVLFPHQISTSTMKVVIRSQCNPIRGIVIVRVVRSVHVRCVAREVRLIGHTRGGRVCERIHIYWHTINSHMVYHECARHISPDRRSDRPSTEGGRAAGIGARTDAQYRNKLLCTYCTHTAQPSKSTGSHDRVCGQAG
jgi:hypothetical protein